MYIWIHGKYSSTSFKQRLWQRKIALIWQNKFFKSCVSLWCSEWSRSCLHVQINRVRLPTTLFSVSLYRFFFPVWSLFFKAIFPFGRFFFILTADPAGHALGSIYILSLSPEFYFGKGISKAFDLHTGQAYDQIKTISCQDMSLLWNSWIFSMLVDIMTNNTQYITNCTNLHPTSTSDPLAKVKLAFCTSS